MRKLFYLNVNNARKLFIFWNRKLHCYFRIIVKWHQIDENWIDFRFMLGAFKWYIFAYFSHAWCALHTSLTIHRQKRHSFSFLIIFMIESIFLLLWWFHSLHSTIWIEASSNKYVNWIIFWLDCLSWQFYACCKHFTKLINGNLHRLITTLVYLKRSKTKEIFIAIFRWFEIIREKYFFRDLVTNNLLFLDDKAQLS